MATIGGLRLIGLNQLIDGCCAMTFSTFVGNWLDRHKRNFGIQVVLAFNNLSVTLSAVALYCCLLKENCDWIYMVLLVVALVFNAISQISSGGEKLAFTKDWIVVMATQPGSTVTLAGCNSIMHIIDQAASMISPIIVGILLTTYSYKTICIFLAAWNLVSWGVEASMLRKLYNFVPELAIRHTLKESEVTAKLVSGESSKEEPSAKLGFFGMLHTYAKQPVLLPAVALSLLYFTVLGSDGLGIGFAKTMGLPENYIGYSRFVGSLLGVISASSYPFFERNVGVMKTGFIGFLSQQFFLLFAVGSVFLPGSPFDLIGFTKSFDFQRWFSELFSGQSFVRMTGEMNPYIYLNETDFTNSTLDPAFNYEVDWSTLTIANHSIISILVFLFGIVFARFGLWLIDISITQLMQEKVPERQRGTVFGVENALCNAFSVLKDIMIILLPDVKTFGLLVIISFAAVFAASFIYIVFMAKTSISDRRNRKNIPLTEFKSTP
uniref:Solute carrier family 40 protein n=1 Tax=Rhabditophanes sp. KR3021 TaxID=114890 RepID=A0AC35TX58_9BILA